MEQSPSWLANIFSATQDIPSVFWNQQVHHRFHKCPPPVPILSHIDPVHALTSHFLKIYFNIILPSTPGPSMCSLFLKLPHQNPVCTFLSPIRATCPTYLIPLDFITRIIVGIYTTYVKDLRSRRRWYFPYCCMQSWDGTRALAVWWCWQLLILRSVRDCVWNMGVVIVTAEDSNTRRKAVLTDLKHLRSKHASHSTAVCDVEWYDVLSHVFHNGKYVGRAFIWWEDSNKRLGCNVM